MEREERKGGRIINVRAPDRLSPTLAPGVRRGRQPQPFGAWALRSPSNIGQGETSLFTTVSMGISYMRHHTTHQPVHLSSLSPPSASVPASPLPLSCLLDCKWCQGRCTCSLQFSELQWWPPRCQRACTFCVILKKHLWELTNTHKEQN